MVLGYHLTRDNRLQATYERRNGWITPYQLSASATLFTNYHLLFVALRKHFNSIGQELTNDKFVLLCCIGACNGYTANGLHTVYNSHYCASGYRSFIRRLGTLVDSGLVERYHIGTDGRYRRYRLSRACLALVRRSIGKDVLSSIIGM